MSNAEICQITPRAATADGFLVKNWTFGAHIRAGVNGMINSAIRNDDVLDSNMILPGPNGTLDSQPSGDDVVVDGLFNGREYPYVKGFDACDQTGVSGQGNPNPPGAFENHYVVKYAGRIYDPSYGSGPYANNLEHENASIDGICEAWFAKKKGSGSELIYAP